MQMCVLIFQVCVGMFAHDWTGISGWGRNGTLINLKKMRGCMLFRVFLNLSRLHTSLQAIEATTQILTLCEVSPESADSRITVEALGNRVKCRSCNVVMSFQNAVRTQGNYHSFYLCHCRSDMLVATIMSIFLYYRWRKQKQRPFPRTILSPTAPALG